MNRKTEALVLVLVAMFFAAPRFEAQEQPNPAPATNKENPERKPAHAYRVDFSISELENGKRINSRHYAMDLAVGPWSTVKIGSRIPVSPSQGTFQYIDLGTNIDCQLNEEGDDVSLIVRSDFSNLADPEEQHSSQPIIRQIKIEGRTVTPPGKPAVMGTVDDPASNRQFELEATATRLR